MEESKLVKIERMVEELKDKVALELKNEHSIRDLYQLTRILQMLHRLECEIGGTEKAVQEFIEKLMRRVQFYESKVGRTHSKIQK